MISARDPVPGYPKATFFYDPLRAGNLNLPESTRPQAYGIGFTLCGGPDLDGADKIFERSSLFLGETALQTIDRHARMRNVHLVDDENGDLVAGRAVTRSQS